MKSNRASYEASAQNVKHFTVHSDVLIDVLYVLQRSGIRYQINEIDRDRNNVILMVSTGKSASHEEKALKNIEYILSEYMDFMIGL
ncbi:MAG TPA: hypothetical protein VIM75_14405 [Ohtaekwangia sp.]|uniref:hypothetical protein n=1 Tax=Ohtaekwangia sp. TaxID=2066019 RepID=UPI002F931316